jgi:Ca-activated chloride channel family protein
LGEAVVFRILVLLSLIAAPTVVSAQVLFRTGVDLVNLGVTVVDKRGTLVTDLGPGDFEIVEEGRKQKIDFCVRGDDHDSAQPPVRLGLLFDTSGSMTEDVQFARSAAIKFLNLLNWAEDMTLVDFDTEVRVARYSQSDFPRLVERLRNRRPDGWTALYDALGVYLDGAAEQLGQKILVLYTDGGDTRSSLTFGDALDLVKASDVTLYVIGFLEHQASSVRSEQRMRLQQLAEMTGGQAFFPMSIKQLDQMYQSVLGEIKARYTLGYLPANTTTDGAWRDVQVRLTRPDLKGARIRARHGYFAPFRSAASRP